MEEDETKSQEMMRFNMWSGSEQCFDIERPDYQHLQEALGCHKWNRLLKCQNNLITGIQQYLTLQERLSKCVSSKEKKTVAGSIDAVTYWILAVQNEQRTLLQCVYEQLAASSGVRVLHPPTSAPLSPPSSIRISLEPVRQGPSPTQAVQTRAQTKQSAVVSVSSGSTRATIRRAVSITNITVTAAAATPDKTSPPSSSVVVSTLPFSQTTRTSGKRSRGRPRKMPVSTVPARSGEIGGGIVGAGGSCALRRRPHRTRLTVAAELRHRARAEKAQVCLLRLMGKSASSAGTTAEAAAESALNSGDMRRQRQQQQLRKRAKHVHMSFLGLVPASGEDGGVADGRSEPAREKVADWRKRRLPATGASISGRCKTARKQAPRLAECTNIVVEQASQAPSTDEVIDQQREQAQSGQDRVSDLDVSAVSSCTLNSVVSCVATSAGSSIATSIDGGVSSNASAEKSELTVVETSANPPAVTSMNTSPVVSVDPLIVSSANPPSEASINPSVISSMVPAAVTSANISSTSSVNSSDAASMSTSALTLMDPSIATSVVPSIVTPINPSDVTSVNFSVVNSISDSSLTRVDPSFATPVDTPNFSPDIPCLVAPMGASGAEFVDFSEDPSIIDSLSSSVTTSTLSPIERPVLQLATSIEPSTVVLPAVLVSTSPSTVTRTVPLEATPTSPPVAASTVTVVETSADTYS